MAAIWRSQTFCLTVVLIISFSTSSNSHPSAHQNAPSSPQLSTANTRDIIQSGTLPPTPPILSDAFHNSLKPDTRPALPHSINRANQRIAPIRKPGQLRDGGEGEGGGVGVPYYGGPYLINSMVMQLYEKAQLQQAQAAAQAAANQQYQQQQYQYQQQQQQQQQQQRPPQNQNHNSNSIIAKPPRPPPARPRPTPRPVGRVTPHGPAVVAMVMQMIQVPYPYYGYED
ncbi:hypothetical protein BV898_14676 [Hypsibius exemplaris]|uniref:Uncharacterized protein n=1 Tax=Hypsibius exemplaris TaxID=2072580 RepID=A0A9X6RJS6_HYPEX|nr:hypothetical protein BV898_14676 [Hypsibius exemplaris]